MKRDIALCCCVTSSLFFCYFWIYDNVLINSLGIPGGRTKTRKGNSRVSLEGLLSGEQIFSRETKLVVLPRWLLLWCWMAKLLDGRTLPWVAIKRHRYTLIQPFSKKEKTIQEHLLEGIVFEKCKQKPGKPMIEHGWMLSFQIFQEPQSLKNKQKCLILKH